MPLFFSRRKIENDKFTTKIELTKPTYFDFQQSPTNKRSWRPVLKSRASWIKAMRAEAGTKDVLIHVHGFNSTQAGTLSRHRKLEARLRKAGYKGAVVSYDWPNRGKGSPSAYGFDYTKRAPFISGFLVEDAILPLLNSQWKPRIHVFGHSMGAFVITDGFSKFGDTFGPGDKPWKVNHVIFASGDAHRSIYAKGGGGSLTIERHSRRLTNFQSSKDEVLSLAHKWHGLVQRVGRAGLPSSTSHEHFNVNASSKYKKPNPPVSNYEQMLHSHRWWFDDDWFYGRMAKTLKIGS